MGFNSGFKGLISSDFCLAVSAIASCFCRSQTSEYFPVSRGFILLLLKHYSPFWTWVSGTIKYLPVSGHCIPFPIPVIFKSSSTSLVHLFRGLPVVHVSLFSILAVISCSIFSPSSVLSGCPHKRVYLLCLYHYIAWSFDDEKRIFSSSSPCLFTE